MCLKASECIPATCPKLNSDSVVVEGGFLDGRKRLNI